MNHAAAREVVSGFARLAAVLLTLPSLAVAVAVAAADEPASLSWRLEPGRVVHFRASLSTAVESRPEGREGVRSESSQDVAYHWTVGEVADGQANMTLTVDEVRVKLGGEAGSPAFEYDSASAEERRDGPFAARLVAVLGGLKDAELTFRMDGRGDVSDVKLPASLATLIRQAGAMGGAALLSEDGVRNLVVQSIPLLPEGSVRPRATWTRQVAAPMPMMGTLILDRTYTYDGPRPASPGLHEVDVAVRTTLQPAPEAALEAELLNQSADGGFTFDASAGLVESYHLDESLTFALSARGQKVERRLESRLKVDVVRPPR